MKILFFLGLPNPYPGAGWTRIGFFVKYFKNRGYDVTVTGTFSPKSLKMAGFKIWRGIPLYNVIPTFWTENIFSLAFNILSSIILAPILSLVLRPKVVVISLPTVEPSVGAYIASKLVCAKIVFDVRDLHEDYIIGKTSSKLFRRAYKLLKALMTSLYNKGNLVVTVTEPLAHSLRLRGLREVEVVPNGADVNIFRPYKKDAVRRKLGLKNDEFVILYVGVIREYHRLDVVVRAFERLNNAVRNKIRLLIVGSGNVAKVLRLAEDFGLKFNVLYLGVKSDEDELAQIISAGDVGIVPFDDNPLWKNALPVKFCECCACGIPVIATVYDESLLASIIKEHGVGLCIPPMDDEKLSEAILWMYRNAQLREVMGRRARALVEEKFDRNKIADEFLKLVEVCVSNE